MLHHFWALQIIFAIPYSSLGFTAPPPPGAPKGRDRKYLPVWAAAKLATGRYVWQTRRGRRSARGWAQKLSKLQTGRYPRLLYNSSGTFSGRRNDNKATFGRAQGCPGMSQGSPGTSQGSPGTSQGFEKVALLAFRNVLITSELL